MSARPTTGRRPRVLVSAGFSEGHALPALGLAEALRERGATVVLDLPERWRDRAGELGAELHEAREYASFAEPRTPGRQSVEDAVAERRDVIRAVGADAVVADLVASAPALAAELEGTPLATLVPVVFPVQGTGLPPFEHGLLAARGPAGRAFWRLAEPLTRPVRPKARWLREVPRRVAVTRAAVGLPPLGPETPMTTYGPLSDRLILVATFPQLEYPRRWPAQVRICGPLLHEIPAPEVELPPGRDPLVLVASSTVHSGTGLIDVALGALAEEPVRVVATLNRRGASWDGPVPANAVISDWVAYSQAMAAASVVITAGGHGTVARSLAEGTPVVVSPLGAESAENGARVAWAGAGVMVPRSLTAPGTLRAGVRQVLTEPRFRHRAAELAAWAAGNPGGRRAAALVEELACG